MFEKLRRLLARGCPTDVVRECRDCGTVVDRVERCPRCGSAGIVRYEID